MLKAPSLISSLSLRGTDGEESGTHAFSGRYSFPIRLDFPYRIVEWF